jgi:hypothetical protein
MRTQPVQDRRLRALLCAPRFDGQSARCWCRHAVAYGSRLVSGTGSGRAIVTARRVCLTDGVAGVSGAESRPLRRLASHLFSKVANEQPAGVSCSLEIVTKTEEGRQDPALMVALE